MLTWHETQGAQKVLEWVATGKPDSDIAAILGARGRTVAKHLERIFQVLQVDNRTAAADKAHQVMRRKTDRRDGSMEVTGYALLVNGAPRPLLDGRGPAVTTARPAFESWNRSCRFGLGLGPG